MTKIEVAALHTGDEITWTDPDDGICSRTGVILEIDKANLFRNVVSIVWEDGSSVSGFIWEFN